MSTTNSPSIQPADSLSAARPGTNATVSASAGTGKTWLLVTRIIRLLLANAEPGSILALTFTRKAAAEMQIRLQERLHQLAVTDRQSLHTLLAQSGCEPSPENMNRARALYERMIHADYQIRLQTFHSFCQDILARFPLEADITPGFELIENTALLQQQAWEELFAAATRNPQSQLANDLDALMQACNGPANTKTALYSMLDHRSDWWAFCEGQKDSAAYACRRLQQQLQIDTDADPFEAFFSAVTYADLASFAELLRKHATRTNLAQAAQIDQALGTGITDEDSFRQLLPAFLKKDLTPRSRKPSKSQAASLGDAGERRFLGLHQRISAQMQETLEIDKRLRALALNAVWYRSGQVFIDGYQRLKLEQRVLDFTDLEWSCYRLLNTADNAHWVQYKIDQRIDHVLIDEFQDTNPTQWQLIMPLLEEIAAGDIERERSFFLVGDEKQSIYSFRRANPKLQQQAASYLARHMSAIEVRLDASRRSSAAIMNAVNAIFSSEAILQHVPEFSDHGTHLAQVPGSVSLFPLHNTGEAAEEPETPAAVALRNPLLQPRSEQISDTRTDEAHQIVDRIEQLMRKPLLVSDKDEYGEDYVRPLAYGDVMILLRNRTHIGVYESVLRDRGIPFIGSQRGSLLDNQEIQDLEKLLDSLITPFNNLSIAQVLKSPIFAASDDDLVRLSQLHKDTKWYHRLLSLTDEMPDGHPLQRAALLLPRWHRLADTVPVHDLLDRIYAEGNIIKRYTASVPTAQQQRVSANLQRFHEMSLELDSGRYPSLSHFLHHIRSLRGHREGRPDEPAAAHGLSRVNLMTIHASKGLEAPVVILADCDSSGGRHSAYSTLVDWPAQSRKPDSYQLITASEHIDAITGQILARKEQAQQREELNLLYVAITRARQYLLITGSACRSSSGWYDHMEAGMKKLTRAKADGVYTHATGKYRDPVVRSPESHTEPGTNFDARLTRPFQNLTTDEHLIAPSLSAVTGPAVPAVPADGEGIQRGIVIHRALDLMSRTPPLTIEQTEQHIRQLPGLADADDIDAWIREASDTVQNSAFNQLFDPACYREALNELPVMYRLDGRSVFGIIDRLVFKAEDILLIDYKTHQVDDKQQLQTLALNYREQMSYYRTGVAQLWPGKKIKSGLLFTNSARIIWLDEDAPATQRRA